VNADILNIVAVARREFVVRARTRTFLIGTVVLVVGAVAIALVPVITRAIDRADQTKVAVWNGAVEPVVTTDPVATLTTSLNPPSNWGDPTAAATPASDRHFIVEAASSLEKGRAAVAAGRYAALLSIDRPAPDGELRFVLYTDAPATSGSVQLLQQATNTIAIGDRLDRLSIGAADRAGLFAPAEYMVAWPDPNKTGAPPADVNAGSNYLLTFGLSVLVFMMIVLYGNWVAMSVVEEKQSRVMEVILNAATPFQLLGGKVVGVGSVALIQFGAIVVAGGVGLLLQGWVADLVLGSDSGSIALPSGLTIGMLAAFAVFGILGFLLYAVLFATAGSLVSRQEDVSQAVMPLILLSTVGYMISVYAGTGLFDLRDTSLRILAQIPFFSPFMALGRIVQGQVTFAEVLLSVALLVGAIVGCLWIAARIYAAGVLLYGQRPGLRSIVRMARAGM
jgi:ABC-2 type transport system permease protein